MIFSQLKYQNTCIYKLQLLPLLTQLQQSSFYLYDPHNCNYNPKIKVISWEVAFLLITVVRFCFTLKSTGDFGHFSSGSHRNVGLSIHLCFNRWSALNPPEASAAGFRDEGMLLSRLKFPFQTTDVLHSNGDAVWHWDIFLCKSQLEFCPFLSRAEHSIISINIFSSLDFSSCSVEDFSMKS